MKINEKNLCAFASSATPIDHEGWLDMRVEVGKTYQKRWFSLKGNLLFYFDKKGEKEPVGVVILEGCTIELTEEEAYSFKIVFHCDGGKTYYLSTNTHSSMEAWMKALACASYDYMKLMVAELQRQLDEAKVEEAEEALGVTTPPEPRAPPRALRHNPFNRAAPPVPSAVTAGDERGQRSRHHKENSTDTPRKKSSFRHIHTTYGRKILADRNEYRVQMQKKNNNTELPLIQL